MEQRAVPISLTLNDKSYSVSEKEKKWSYHPQTYTVYTCTSLEVLQTRETILYLIV